MLQVSEIVKKTEELFDRCNEHFYAGELVRPAITVSPDGGKKIYGWCTVMEMWDAGGERYYEINLCAEYLDRPMIELCVTLLHEMAHLYNIIHGIEDTSNNGYYHNLKFKQTAQEHGLLIEKHEKYGWTLSQAAPETTEWLTQSYGEKRMGAKRIQINEITDTEHGTKGVGSGIRGTKSKNRSIKYICPECGAIVRATREVYIICGDCSVAFQKA